MLTVFSCEVESVDMNAEFKSRDGKVHISLHSMGNLHTCEDPNNND